MSMINVELRPPSSTDGAAVHALIEQCKPLDTNSLYCNLLQCSHFAQTCVLADNEGSAVGFASGYLVPGRDDVLFVWQIAVHESMRGQKLALRMLQNILSRPHLQHIRYIETTITPNNQASIGLFEKLAGMLNTDINQSVLFGRDSHFAGVHDDECLFKIGPFEL